MRAIIASVLALASCQVAATKHLGTDALRTNDREPGLGGGVIRQEQLESLRGLTVEQARDRLHRFGHRGTVEVVRDTQFHDQCALDTVCFTEPVTGMPVEGAIVLWTNPTIAITAPPP